MNPLRFALTAVALIGLPAVDLSARLAAEEPDWPALYQKCVKSCAFIVIPTKEGHVEGSGSGSLIDAEQRLVTTTASIVDKAESVYVQFPVHLKDGSMMTEKQKYVERIPAGQALKGKVLFRDASRDVAIIQLDKLPADTPVMPLAKKSVRADEPVFNIGNSVKMDHTFSMRRAEVRAVGLQDIELGEAARIKCRMVTLTNPTSTRDNGGPTIDQRGYQVAVTRAGNPGALPQNVNSAIDVTEVWAFLSEKKIKITNPGDKPPEPKIPPRPPRPPEPLTDEQMAAQMLRRAKLFGMDEESRPIYKRRLTELLEKYPGTAAGKQAKDLLDKLK